MAAPADAQEKWLYVSSVWDGTASPVYTNYSNILGNSVGANQAAVDRLLGYAYAQGYTGLFMYNQGNYQSGATYTATGKAIMRAFIAQASALGLEVGAVSNTSANSLDAIIEYNNSTTSALQRFTAIATENEWWWWSYNDSNQGPCGEYAFIQMKTTLNNKKAAMVAAGLELYGYIGFARDVGYTYSGTYNSNCGSAVRNGSTVTGMGELDQLVGILDKFMLHDYIVNDTGCVNQAPPCSLGSPFNGNPTYSYMRSRLLTVNNPIDWLPIVSSEQDFSGPWFEGKIDIGAVATFPKKDIEDAYDYIMHSLGGAANPLQGGTPVSFDAETDGTIIANVTALGIVNFKYNEMANDTTRLSSKNGSTFYVSAGSDQTSNTFPGSMGLTGRFLDDYLPLGGARTTVWSVVSGPVGGTFTNGSTLTPTFNWNLPGIYTVRLTASDSDVTLTDDAIITVNGSETPFTVLIGTQSDLFCAGDCNAEIICQVMTGGTGPFTYLWDDGQTTQAIVNVCDDEIHSCTVTDSLGATATDSYHYVSPYSQIVITTSTVNVTVNGGSDGEILATGSDGEGNYQYSIDGGATWLPLLPDPAPYNFTGLTAGPYTVEVRDSNLCTTSTNVLLTEPSITPVIVLTSVVTPACNNTSPTGSINLSVSGGTAPYTYSWTGPGGYTAITEDISGLYSGTYTVEVTDSAAVVATQIVVVGISTPAQNATVRNVTCHGANDGSIEIALLGGTAPFTYQWPQLGSVQSSVFSLAPGTYTCIVRDANGCSSTNSYTITQPTAITLTESHSNPSSLTNNDGTISVTATGGTSPYTYQWSNGETTADITGLSSGSYTVTVTDVNDCSAALTIVLFAQDYLEVAAIRSKCCLADYAYQYNKKQATNPERTKCLKTKMQYLTLAVCLLDKYVNDETCIDTEELSNLIENINNICGCCDCEFDDKIFDDTL